ncbi:hypothetical protein QX204_13490 [Nocardia sp. PE-7]|uniref:hypothetical protein n=1 Tax=Nocardia sp. PE-7 TaxID=3058426 RepID=UPI002658498A|nr:hypothetical protein [Nocardia sp. PE-7]WKG12417.1 hypothetical protein QX204_13490 [Nocardia sp. PE-7]
MVTAVAQQTIACAPEEYLEFAMDVERYASVDDKLGPMDWVRRNGNVVEFRFRPSMPGIPGPAPKMIARGVLTPGERVDVGLSPLPASKLWHRLMRFNCEFRVRTSRERHPGHQDDVSRDHASGAVVNRTHPAPQPTGKHRRRGSKS